MKVLSLIILALCLCFAAATATRTDDEKFQAWQQAEINRVFSLIRSQPLDKRHDDSEDDEDEDEDEDEGSHNRYNDWQYCRRRGARRNRLYGIVTAFPPEAVEILSKLSGPVKEVDIAGRRFFLGKLDHKDVIVTSCGIGMNNAALTTQLLLDHFKVKKLFFSGIAGGVNPAHRVGDVVIARQWGNNQHQRFIRAQADTTGFVYTGSNSTLYSDSGSVPSFTRPSCAGCAPALPGGMHSGFSLTQTIQVLKNGGDIFLPIVPNQFWFPVDPALLAAAEDAIAAGITLTNTGFNPITQTNFTLPYTPTVGVGAAGISSSTFVDNAEIRIDYFNHFHADVLDMESAAFMHVCEQNQVQCLVIRSLSDLAGGEEGLNTILTFINFASKNSVTVLRAILEQL